MFLTHAILITQWLSVLFVLSSKSRSSSPISSTVNTVITLFLRDLFFEQNLYTSFASQIASVCAAKL